MADQTDTSPLHDFLEEMKRELAKQSQEMKQQLTQQSKDMTKQIQDLQQQADANLRTQENILASQNEIHVENQNLVKRVEDVSTRMKDLELRLDERFQKRNDELKTEMFDHVREQILLSEGSQNAETKRYVDNTIGNLESHLVVKFTEEASRIETKVKELDERMVAQEERVIPHSSHTAQLPRYLEIKMPLFKDDRGCSAFRFIRDVENYFKINPVAKRLRLSIIPNMLDGTPKDWYHASLYRFTKYEDFTDAFIKKYCNESAQFAIREQLIKTSYNAKSGLTQTEHFIRQVLRNHDLKEPFNEQQLITVVLRHYDSNTQQVVLARNVQSITGMEEVLQQLDQVSSRADRKSEPHKQDEHVHKVVDTKEHVNKGNQGGQNRYAPYNRPMNSKPDSDQQKKGGSQGGNKTFTSNNPSNTQQEGHKSGSSKPHLNVISEDKSKNLVNKHQEGNESGANTPHLNVLNADELDKLDTPVINVSSPTVSVSCYGKQINVLIDTGANLNCLSESAFNDLNSTDNNIPVLPCQQKQVQSALKDKNILCKRQAYIELNLNGLTMQATFMIIKNLTFPMILGVPFLIEHKVVIDVANNNITLNNEKGKQIRVDLLNDKGNHQASIIQLGGIQQEDRICELGRSTKEFTEYNSVKDNVISNALGPGYNNLQQVNALSSLLAGSKR